MSKIEYTTTITRAYLRNKTKDEIIEHVMRLLDENDHHQEVINSRTKALRNCSALAIRRNRKAEEQGWNEIIRFCEDAGVYGSILRGDE